MNAPTRPRVVLAAGAAGLLVVVLALLVVGLRGTGWQDWFRHRPPAFTLLSFTDPTALPTTYAPGRELELAVTLVTHRDRTATLDYRVVVATSAGAAVRPGSQDSITLAPGASGDVRVPVVLTAAGDVEVSVELVDPSTSAAPGSGQHVDVLLTQAPA